MGFTVSILQMTTCSIHILPVVMLYIQRWEIGENHAMINRNSSVIPGFLHSLAAYLTWQIAHIVLQLLYIEKHPELETSQRYYIGRPAMAGNYWKLGVHLGMF